MFSLQDAEGDYEIFDYAGEAGDVCDEFESCGLGDLAVRAVRSSLSSNTAPHEVILDSGADVTVLPMDIFGDVGVSAQSGVRLRDAQGEAIPQSSGRAQVTFEVQDVEGKPLRFTDKVILAKVKQALLCAGKLMKGNWLPKYDSCNNLVMSDGERAFPLQWSRNSLSARMRIYRLQEEDEEDRHIRSVVELSADVVARRWGGS